MSIKRFGEMLSCVSHDCHKCDLGENGRFDEPEKRVHQFSDDELEQGEHLKRTCGFGNVGSPVMLVGETPRDMSSGYGGRAGGVFSLKEADFLEIVAGEKIPVVRAVQRLNIPTDAIYGTTAIKCALPKTVLPDARHRKSCLVNHLGVEIEAIEPAVIWVTGRSGTDMVRRHFSARSLPDISPGQYCIFEAPGIWRFQRIMFARSPHPSQVAIGSSSYDDLEKVAARVILYLSEMV